MHKRVKRKMRRILGMVKVKVKKNSTRPNNLGEPELGVVHCNNPNSDRNTNNFL